MGPASDSAVQSTYATTHAPVRSSPIPIARVVVWYRDGLRLWGRAPFLLLAAALVPFVTEAMWQLLVPLAGVLLSKILTPVAMSGQFVLLHRFVRGDGLRFLVVFAGLRGRWFFPLVVLGVLSLVIFGTQVLTAWSIYGAPAIDEAVVGQFGKYPALATTRFILILILPGLVPATLLMFSIPLVVLGGLSPVDAVRASVRRVLGAPVAFTVFTLVAAAIVTVSLVTPHVGMLLLLLSSPWMLTTNYAAYRDLFGGVEEE